MKVLAITNEFPLPLDRGGPVRFFGLARALADVHDVHMLALRRDSTTPALERDLSELLGGPVEAFDRPPGHHGGAGGWARALRAGRPPWVAAQHSPPLQRRAVELVAWADVAVLLDDYAGVYAHALAPRLPVVADKSNVLGLSAAEAPAAGVPAKGRRALVVHLVRRFERAYVGELSGLVATSAEESERLRSLYGRPADAVVPSAVDLPAEVSPTADSTVGWLGSHEYEHNVGGLLRFVEQGWDGRGHNGATLLVAGGGAPPAVRELDGRADVEVLGFVERLDDFLSRLSVAVVPLWKGAGVKVKTLTFMGAGIPVVGTPVAMEGVEAEHGRNCLVAADPAGLAAEVESLLADPARAREIGAAGRRLVAERYTWDSIAPRFREAVERAMEEIA